MGSTDDDQTPASELRQPCREGASNGVSTDSWLRLEDDTLLHRIETLPPSEQADERLIEVVRSDRHFFVRQEAAKRIHDKKLLFDFEGDRHIGQILVRHLTRQEDLDYLSRLVERSHHVEVQRAAQVQLNLLRQRLGDVEPTTDEAPGTPPAGVQASEAGVDGNLLGWAMHFLVEAAWNHLGTESTRHLLLGTHVELLPTHPSLSFFRVQGDARVHVDISGGTQLPREALDGTAAWALAFLDAARRVAPEMERVELREATRLMADALEAVGFYAACEGGEAA